MIFRCMLPFIVLVFFNGFVQASSMSESDVYVRCHSRIARSLPAANDPLWQSVINGKSSAANACIKLLDEARLTRRSGGRELIASSSNQRAKNIIKNFQDLHSSFFIEKDFTGMPGGRNITGAYSIMDPSQPALYFTHALFAENVPARSVVTSTRNLKAVRESTRTSSYFIMSGINAVDPDPVDPNINITSPNIKQQHAFLRWGSIVTSNPGDDPLMNIVLNQNQMIEEGELVGITDVTPIRVSPRLAQHNSIRTLMPNENQIEINGHFGAGLLGTQTYQLMNTEFNETRLQDGGLIIPRRWSNNMFSDLMCRELPLLRPGDVQAVSGSNVAFRQSRSCMQCHASSDPAATVLRNFWIGATMPNNSRDPAGVLRQANSNQFLNSRFIIPLRPDLPSESALPDRDTSFHRRPPKGELYYRSYDGKLIRRPVANLVELGEAIASEEDFYVCTAKRYYHFFTGINVNLRDIGDSSSDPLNSVELKHRTLVENLGKNLMKHQSLRELIKEIVSSEVYRARNYLFSQEVGQ